MSGCCNDVFFVETPQSIKDKDNIDVFEQIIPNTAYEYTKKRSELWARFRYRGIGSCDRAYWLQCMKDRYNLIEDTWDVKIKAWNAYQTSITGNGISFAQSSGNSSSSSKIEREDTPDNPASTTVYLSDRTTTSTSSDYENFENLESETVDDYIKAVPDPWDGFTTQFMKLFCFTI